MTEGRDGRKQVGLERADANAPEQVRNVDPRHGAVPVEHKHENTQNHHGNRHSAHGHVNAVPWGDGRKDEVVRHAEDEIANVEEAHSKGELV